jgi:hypothetical protein
MGENSKLELSLSLMLRKAKMGKKLISENSFLDVETLKIDKKKFFGRVFSMKEFSCLSHTQCCCVAEFFSERSRKKAFSS